MGEKGRLQTSQLQKVVGSIEDVVGASEYKLCSNENERLQASGMQLFASCLENITTIKMSFGQQQGPRKGGTGEGNLPRAPNLLGAPNLKNILKLSKAP